MKRLLTLSIGALSLTLFASCGDSDDGNEDSGTAGTTDSSIESGSNPTTLGSDSGSGGTNDTEGSSNTSTHTSTESSGTENNSTSETGTTTNPDATTTTESGSSETEGSTNETTGTDTDTDTTDTTGTGTDSGSGGIIMCGNKVWECGNGIDDDGDGRIDLGDKECTSPCDDDEGSFLTSLPGQNKDCKADCYFDQDSGVGNDHCEWDLTCDSQDPGGAVGCAYDPDKMSCEASIPSVCLDFCEPLLPNGCDCFGCCQIETDAGTDFIYLGSSGDCSFDNPDACGRCTFNYECANECDKENCELCFGEDTLPPECEEATCPDGIKSCNSIDDCDSGQFCQTGCCIAIAPG